MEAFSLLKYWRGNGGGGGGGGGVTLDGGANVRATTIVTDVSQYNTAETDEDDEEEEDEDGDDDGPFFDLEFAVPDEDDEAKNGDDCGNSAENDDDVESEEEATEELENEEEEREFKFTLSSGSSGGDQTDPNVSLSSPPGDLFFKGRLVPVEPPGSSSPEQSSNKPQFPVSLLKSATRFRVLMLKFKKPPKAANATGNDADPSPDQNASESSSSVPKPQKQNQNRTQSQQQNRKRSQSSKLFTVKYKVEEVPIVSLFTRDNSTSRSKPHHQKQNPADESASDSEKRFSKDVMQRYLKMVKPLYVRVSKRYGEKLKLSGQVSLGSLGVSVSKAETPPPSTAAQISQPAESKAEAEKPEAVEAPPPGNMRREKQVSLLAGLRVVCKHLGKSRSASSAVVAAPSAAGAVSSRDVEREYRNQISFRERKYCFKSS